MANWLTRRYTEVESAAVFEERMREYQAEEKLKNKMAGYTDLYTEGRCEICQIVE